MSAEFGPLCVRRYRVAEPAPPIEEEDEAVAGDAPSSSAPAAIPAEPAPSEEPPAVELACVAPSYDEERFEATIRELAIRFASIAAARALRVALADEAAIAKYVDDALRACGRAGRATVRLCPRDALAYRSTRDIDVVSDDSCEAGQVVIELPTGSLGATIDERAALLVRAAAC